MKKRLFLSIPISKELQKEAQKVQKLIKHKKSLENLLSKEPEIRPFLPHITLARFKPHKQKEILELNEQIEWKQQVTHFTLMQSHLSSTHAEYETLEEFTI